MSLHHGVPKAYYQQLHNGYSHSPPTVIQLSPYASIQDPFDDHAGQVVEIAKNQKFRHDFDAISFLSLGLSLACLIFALVAIAHDRFAVWIGQTNQLIILGAMLAVMAFITFKQAQILLLLYEARFGSSTLQNYDAILRDSKFDRHVSISIRICLWFLFILPLVLSAVYKNFIGGSTTISMSVDTTLFFAPSKPPGLFDAWGKALFANATSYLYAGFDAFPKVEAPLNTSYGYNIHVINHTTVAMLDTPVSYNITYLQSVLRQGRYLTISAPVGVTYARLNSTPESPERLDAQYWPRMRRRLGDTWNITKGLGNRGYFNMWSGNMDQSIQFLSLYNTDRKETFESRAIAFDLYRGTANGVWRISPSSITLISATNFETDFRVDRMDPDVFKDGSWSLCNTKNMTYTSQHVIGCSGTAFAYHYIHMLQEYVIGTNHGTDTGVPLSYWVATVAIMAWADASVKVEWAGIPTPLFQYMLQKPNYTLSATYPTLSRHWGLYVTLTAQPMLLLVIFIARFCLRNTPISTGFGTAALLAGAKRANLDVLHGASFNGKLKHPVKVDIVVNKDDFGHDNAVQYLFSRRD